MKYLLLILLAVAVVTGCSDGPSSIDGGTTDADTDADTDSDADTDTDTDADIDCNQGEYSGDFEIATQSDVATLAGYTSISGDLFVECTSCSNLSELVCLTSVGKRLFIGNNAALTNLNGLSGITSVSEHCKITENAALANLDGLSALTSTGGSLRIEDNDALTNLDGLSALNLVIGVLEVSENDGIPDCEVCDLLDQLTSAPTLLDIHDNLDDSCTPVPDNCP